MCYDPNYIGRVIIIYKGGSFPEFIDLTPDEFEQAKDIFVDFPSQNPTKKSIPMHCRIKQKNLIRDGFPAIEVEPI